MSSITRRNALASFLAIAFSPRILLGDPPQLLASQLTSLEKKSGGKLGFALLDLSTGKRTGQRLDERFPMCSTFKFLATSFILQRVEQGKEHLDRRIVISKQDLVPYSPVSQQHVGGNGMTVGKLCAAAMNYSDNTAANLLLASFGGPPALTAFLRTIGDNITRLDRNETSLNDAVPGDPRDTTTPAAMLENMHRLLFGNTLTFASRTMLTDWLLANKTGDTRLRAGLPKDWKVGDKTGAGDHGTTNDIAVLWPPHHAPVLVTVYLTQSPLDTDGRNAIHAEVGKALGTAILSA